MKTCSTCRRTYQDETLNFCLQDGTPLDIQTTSEAETRVFTSSSAPTLSLPTGDRPETRYARSNHINIAYQVIGQGPIDIVYVPGWVSHLEYGWESPIVANFYRHLASFSRLILFDKRGTGLSDQTSDLPTLEQRMDDVRAVMEAADSSRAVVFGMSEGGNMSLVFAATYPERTIALITFGAFAKREWDPEYPWAPTPEERQKFYDELANEWGGPIGIEVLAPSLAKDQSFRDWWATYTRRSASPRAALALARMNTLIDVRNVLPAIRVPTLVLHRTGDLDVNVAEGRYIAERIPGAKLVELPGNDHLIYAGDQGHVLNETKSFIKDIRLAPGPESVLATVLLAQVVPQDTAIPERFLSLAKREADWFKGKIANASPGFVATFDGPVRAIRCATAIRDAALRAGFDSRIVLHTGLCDVFDDQISGIAMEISAAIATLAQPGEILTSNAVKDLISGADLDFEERGTHNLGDPGQWRLFAVKRGA
jgi:pimeloyl-ACP methyl ester carboxylesterase